MASFCSNYTIKLNFCRLIKTNVRSYFRFHVSSMKETPQEKLAIIDAKITDKLKIPFKINKEQLSSSINYQSVIFPDVKELATTPRNCVLYFPTFESEPKTIDKVSSIYNDLGLDVIVIKTKHSHLFLPETGKSVVDDLVSKLSGNDLPLNVGNFLIHSTGAGAFFYAILTNQLTKLKSNFNLNRIRGQIFDKLVLSNPSKTLTSYRSSLPKFFLVGKDIFEESAKLFIENPLNVDTLVFHTVEDENSDDAIALIDNWKNRFMDISVSSWSRSVNVENYLSHPKQYERAVETFLVKIGFI